MGKVVKLEPTAKAESGSKARTRRLAPRGVGRSHSVDRRRRPRRDKTALVLGGGGFTGGVYEIGALRALDLLAVNSTVNNFDVYVGTSAGSFIAALCANGVTPEEMMRVVTGQGKATFKDIDIGDLLRPNLREFARKGALLPLRVVSLARELLGQKGGASLMDLVMGMADVLPSGLYTGEGIERYLREVLSEPGRTDDFSELACELYLTATDLDNCERVVFGVEGAGDVPISTAVRASGALPMVYAPVNVAGRDLIDGGVVSTTNLDLAVEAGAKLVLVINPIVPFINDFDAAAAVTGAKHPQRVADMGFAQIGYQVFKLVAHQRLHELAKSWEQRYPGVDIVLIEPEPNDKLMFQTSMMSFTSRVEIARHGFESVTRQLASEYERYHEVAERHGLEISAKRIRKVVAHFDDEPEAVSAWRKILEGTTGALLRQSSAS
jgi:predicted acylesterase/phospholipase RssA